MLQAPTGSGKTVLAAAIIERAQAKGKRVIFTVPAISLVDQTVQAFAAEGVHDVGVIQASRKQKLHRPVQVASIQTLMRRPEIPPADLVIVDEAHRVFDFYGEWMNRPEWKRVPFIGLSATPWSRGLGKLYDDLIIVATTQQLIDEGYLTPFRVYAPSHPDLSQVKIVAGDYHEGQLAEVMSETKLVADVVESWLKHGEGRPTLCFGVDRDHAKLLETEFAAAGVSTAYIDAFTPIAERDEILDRLDAGEIQVVCNVGCLTTGVDRDVRCIILARPTKSEMLFTQIIGRGLRTKAGKSDCVIIDHTDTHLKLGFVTDIHHEKLDDGKRKAKAEERPRESLPRACTQCGFVRQPKIRSCPQCGHVPETKSKVECDDGELVELTAARVTKAKIDQATKQLWYSMFIGYCYRNSKQLGYAFHLYRDKFNEQPRGLSTDPLQPSQEVFSYVRSRMIARAKGAARHVA